MSLLSQTRAANVLLVEDDLNTRQALGTLLRRLGHHVVEASTVAQGIDQLPGQDYAILDLSLPDGVGISVMEQIREHAWPIRVAVATGSSDDALIEHAESLEPELFLRKPIDVLSLLEWVSRPN